MPSRFLVVASFLALAACRRSEPTERAAPDAEAAPSASSASSASAGPAPKQEVRLTLHDRAVKVRFSPPKGWTDNQRENFVSIQGHWLSLLTISLTCDGNCSDKPEVMKKNAFAQAKDEEAAFIKRSSPPYVVEWIAAPKEDPPGVLTWEILAKNDERKLMKHELAVRHLLPELSGMLECTITVDEREPEGTFDKVSPICRTLEFEVEPKAK